MSGYLCRVCGEHHDALPTSYGFPAPDDWFALPAPEQKRRAVLSSDQCIIDRKHFYVLGNIDLPIIGEEEIFTWTVWVSLSEANFHRTTKLWKKRGRESEPPYFGWLSVSLPGYPATLNLKTLVHTRPVGQRPFVELEPTEHPLSVEQRNGITRERIREFAEMLAH